MIHTYCNLTKYSNPFYKVKTIQCSNKPPTFFSKNNNNKSKYYYYYYYYDDDIDSTLTVGLKIPLDQDVPQDSALC
jgi:hypothetical protein